MRGTRSLDTLATLLLGIIPAYAGNTDRTLFIQMVFRDHPRVCGEHMPLPDSSIRGKGSSPRMRGTRLRLRCDRRGQGIIPAYAGNTYLVYKVWLHLRDHPRVCGEHEFTLLMDSLGKGSSPRMRGTLISVFVFAKNAGIIPAYAGNT